MFDEQKLEKSIRNYVNNRRQLGQNAGGSGHIGYKSLSDFKLIEVNQKRFKGNDVNEAIITYSIITESEFSYATEEDDGMEDFYTSHYMERIIVDKDYNIIHSEEIN